MSYLKSNGKLIILPLTQYFRFIILVEMLSPKQSLYLRKYLFTLSSLGVLVISIFVLTFRISSPEPVTPQDSRAATNEAPVRGLAGDYWADIVIGKPDFTNISPYTVVANRLYIPHGVIVDRTSTPNKMYIYDSGNNRILGISNLTACLAASTNPLNCMPDLVIGQPDFSKAGCNGDSGFQNFPTRAVASASTICTLPEDANSVSEGGSGSSMDIDTSGNLYVTDFFNHRVLKYNQPFTTDKIADDVWGQTNFALNTCNKGLSNPDATTLCFSWGENNNWTAGVDVDESGNLWVVDSGNNRVLRFPPGSKTANLVLGQSSFTTRGSGSELNQLRSPAAVRVNPQGKVYVADHGNNRVLVYDVPVTGASGRLFGSGFLAPSSIDLDFDPVKTTQSGVWITNKHHSTLELWNETTNTMVTYLGWRDNGNIINDGSGSVGIDSTGNKYIAVRKGVTANTVLMFSKINPPVNSYSKALFQWGQGNFHDAKGLSSARGVVVSSGQLIVADHGRILFWNIPSGINSLTTAKPADGVVVAPDFSSHVNDCCFAMTADKANHLYVYRIPEADNPHRIEIYNLPLTTGAVPIKTIKTSIPLLGGGSVSLVGPFFGLAASNNGSALWVGERDGHRVFRIRNPLTTPVVDTILGQTNSTGIQCNQGGAIGSTTLCKPGAVAFDRLGNLFVSDHALEIDGNRRLLVFSPTQLPVNNTSVIYAQTPIKTFPNLATWQPVFTADNKMIIGFNPYHIGNPIANPNGGYFPGVFLNPLGTSVIPDAYLKDFYAEAFSAAVDEGGNVYMGDINRARVLIYKNPLLQNTPTPTRTPTKTPTRTPTPGPIGTFNLLSPIDKTVFVTTPTTPLSWSSAANATSYIWTINRGNKANFKTGTVSTTSTPVTLPPGHYTWYVTAKNATSSKSTGWAEFKRPFSKIKPLSSAQIPYGTSQTFQWTPLLSTDVNMFYFVIYSSTNSTTPIFYKQLSTTSTDYLTGKITVVLNSTTNAAFLRGKSYTWQLILSGAGASTEHIPPTDSTSVPQSFTLQ